MRRNYSTLQRLKKFFSFIAFLGLLWLLFFQGMMVFHGGDNPEPRKSKETTTTVLSPTSLLLKRYLKIIGRERHLDFVTVSKRRVPNGPDPIHNRFLRRRCAEDCILAPHFPATNPQRFAFVHRIFGASNVTRMLRELPEELRGEAAESMICEATWRVQDPVYGCVGIIHQLQQQINLTETELVKIRGQIVYHATIAP